MSRAWSEIVRGEDGGGMRDFLDGKPISCGTGLEMRTGDWKRGADGEDQYVARARGVPVRYEIADRYRFIRDRVECRHCGGTGAPCGNGTACDAYECADECSYCDGRGDMSAQVVKPNGEWRWLRVAVLHYAVGNTEFIREVQRGDLFRWPARRRR